MWILKVTIYDQDLDRTGPVLCRLEFLGVDAIGNVMHIPILAYPAVPDCVVEIFRWSDHMKWQSSERRYFSGQFFGRAIDVANRPQSQLRTAAAFLEVASAALGVVAPARYSPEAMERPYDPLRPREPGQRLDRGITTVKIVDVNDVGRVFGQLGKTAIRPVEHRKPFLDQAVQTGVI